MTDELARLAENLLLGDLLGDLTARGGWTLVDHWTQGEFHHDIVLRLAPPLAAELRGGILVVATNCNGGVKEILCFDQVPDRWALWHQRCPDVSEFAGELPPLVGAARTVHWFDPCELLADDARSEIKADCRVRQRGGGWGQRGEPA